MEKADEEKAKEIMDELLKVAEGASVIGSPDNAVKYAPAIVGVTDDMEDPRAVYDYDYDLLLECLVKDGMSIDEAIDWLEFNILRSLPCMKRAPIIVRRLEALG